MRAAAENKQEALATLISAGADVNAGNTLSRWTPLFYAAESNPNPEVIAILLDFGADPKREDKYGGRAIKQAQRRDALKNTDAFRRLKEMSR
jgi:ankyrin repeat protein